MSDTEDTIQPEGANQPETQAGAGNGPGGGDTAGANPLSATVAALEAERDQLKDQLLRALAETENVRKRANRQIADERIYAVEKFARDLLNVSDNFARALALVPPEARGDLPESARNLVEGVELTQKELFSVMARHGVTAVDAGPGAPFDPNLHQAVTQIPSPQPAGTVAETFQAGWKIGDRTLRAAMVAVSLGDGGGK